MPPGTSSAVHRPNTTSLPPLTASSRPEPPKGSSVTVAISLRVESKGSTARRGRLGPYRLGGHPRLAGEHDQGTLGRIADQLVGAVGDRSRSTASLARAAAVTRRRTASVAGGSIVPSGP
jgi:hypothetical protein